MRLCFTLVVFIGIFTGLYAQEEAQKKEKELQQFLERYLEEADEQFDYSAFLDEILVFYETRPSINHLDEMTLRELPFLDELEIGAILDYRSRYGTIYSLNELLAIPNLDRRNAFLLMKLLTLRIEEDAESIPLKNYFKYARGDVFLRGREVLEDQRGYLIADTATGPHNGYLGSPLNLFTRVNFRYGNKMSFGFTADKKAGEQFFNGAQRNGFDFYSFHFYLSNRNNLKALAIGDYQLQFGQGLVLWNGFAFNKTPDAFNIVKRGRGVRPYRSVNPDMFFRGAAATYQLGRFQTTFFYSNVRKGGNLQDGEEVENPFFSSIGTGGFHRTALEVGRRNVLREEVFGGHVSWQKGQLQLGGTFLSGYLSQPLQRPDRLYNQFEFSGQSLMNAAIDYRYNRGNFAIFGEGGWGDNGVLAGLHGFLFKVHSKLKIGALHRHYPRNFHSLWGNAFREGSRPINEQGTYLTLITNPFKYWQVKAYFDHFRFPWLRFRVDAPSSGYDFFTEVFYQRRRSHHFYLRYRIKTRSYNFSENNEVYHRVIPESIHRLRFHFDYKLSESLTLKNRMEWSYFDSERTGGTSGLMLYQDVVWKPNSQWAFYARYAVFDTEDFYTRIYAYENDVLYAFSIPFMMGQGSRYYLMTKYRFSRKLDLWLRWARFDYFGQETVGSGLEMIEGNTRTEVKAQIRWRF